MRYAATAGGIASLGLAVGIPIGVGASQMNADGTYSLGLGLQENLRLRLLSKYGVGMEATAASQQNLLWTIGQGFAHPSLQVLAFASAGVALPFGGFIPVIPNMTWVYNKQYNLSSTDPASSSSSNTSATADPAALAASAPATASNSKGLYIAAPTGSAYPMGYSPATATDALLSSANGPLASLLDSPKSLEWHQLRSFTASQLNAGILEWSNKTLVGLNDGS